MIATSTSATNVSDFELVTRRLRWLCIALVMVTFPWNLPQSKFIYILAGIAALYNISRYLPITYKVGLFASPFTMMVVDNLFAGALIALAGSINTPYSAFLVFIIITATYVYQLRGTLIVTALHILMLAVVVMHAPFAPIVLHEYQTTVIIACVFLMIGMLITRLTHSEFIEREILQRLRQQSDKERSRLVTLVNSLHYAIFVTDAKGMVVHTNQAARILAGTDTIVGRPFAQVLALRPSTNPQATPVSILQQTTSAQHRRDLAVHLPNGTTTVLDITVTPVQQTAKTAEYIIVCEDISSEQTLDQERSGFIAVASHELRTPLAIIEAALETFLQSKESQILPQKSHKLIDQAHRNVLFLGGIIKDMTLLAEAQNDHLPIQLTQIDTPTLLQHLANDFRPQAQQKGLAIAVDVAPACPVILSTSRHISEILQNYTTNAIKYSQQGTITIKAEPAANGGILFSVHDTGIGISPSDQKSLFTKFFRAEDYRTRTTGGTGLGLYLCMEIAQRLGAKVWCQSELNKGSTFYLEVPPHSNLQRDQGAVVEAQVANLVDSL